MLPGKSKTRLSRRYKRRCRKLKFSRKPNGLGGKDGEGLTLHEEVWVKDRHFPGKKDRSIHRYKESLPCLSVCLSACVCVSTIVSVYLCVCASVCLSLHFRLIVQGKISKTILNRSGK